MATAANPFDIQSGAAVTDAAGAAADQTPQTNQAPAQGALVPATNASATGPATAAQFGTQQSTVNAPTETTAGQLGSILSKDSQLMQLARTQASQGMAARGLVNSSMSQGAGVAAMLEKAVPIANADATTYSNRALANQQAINTGGQFNANAQNQFGLQTGAQQFTAQQTQLTQNFQAAQTQLDRAQQTALADKSIGAQQALQTAQQNFDSAQSALNRGQQTALQESQQQFTAGQNVLQITAQKDIQGAQQQFQAAQTALDRAQQTALTDKSIGAQAALQKAQQDFAGAQSELDRQQQTNVATLQITAQKDIQGAQQQFQSAQTALDRAQQTALADKSIGAQAALQKAQQDFAGAQSELDRQQQTTLQTAQTTAQSNLQTAQQTFQSAQTALDRAQQTAITDKSLTAQAALQTAQQTFQSAQSALDRTQQTSIANTQITSAKDLLGLQQSFQSTQAGLDRSQQTAIATLQNQFQQATVSKGFALQTAQNTLTAINNIQADGSLDGTAKTNAIQNVIDTANSTLKWSNAFQNTTVPMISAPAVKTAAAAAADNYVDTNNYSG